MLIEYVSTNPTGPLHVGHGRGAVIGDALARLLRPPATKWCASITSTIPGSRSTRSDAPYMPGCCRPRRGRAIPEDGYPGDYLLELASRAPGRTGRGNRRRRWARTCRRKPRSPRCCAAPEKRPHAVCGARAAAWMLEHHQGRSRAWPSSLTASSASRTCGARASWQRRCALLEETGPALRAGGRAVVSLHGVRGREGPGRAAQQRRTDLLRQRHRLSPARSCERGFERLIDVWGADHHGYIARVKAAIAGAGRGSGALCGSFWCRWFASPAAANRCAWASARASS